MIAEIRNYTANMGEMDVFIEHFEKNVIPIFTHIGTPIVGAWVNREHNEFIWIRTFKDEADREAKTIAFREAVEAGLHTPGKNITRVETRFYEVLYEDKLPTLNGAKSEQ